MQNFSFNLSANTQMIPWLNDSV